MVGSVVWPPHPHPSHIALRRHPHPESKLAWPLAFTLALRPAVGLKQPGIDEGCFLTTYSVPDAVLATFTGQLPKLSRSGEKLPLIPSTYSARALKGGDVCRVAG